MFWTWDVCFLWLKAHCGFVAQTGGPKCSACGWTSSSTVYTGSMSLMICSVTASVTAVHRDAFFSYGTRWFNDSANARYFIALLWAAVVCTSHSEQQVSHYDAGVCLRGQNKFVLNHKLKLIDFTNLLPSLLPSTFGDPCKHYILIYTYIYTILIFFICQRERQHQRSINQSVTPASLNVAYQRNREEKQSMCCNTVKATLCNVDKPPPQVTAMLWKTLR